MKLNPFILTLSALSLVEAFSPSTLNKRFPLSNAVFAKRSSSCDLVLYAKVGIFFGTSTGNTETVADYIAAEFGDDAEGPIEIDGIVGSVADEFAKYDALIVGTPTWNTGADSERSGTGWDEIYYGEMQDLNIAGKKVGVFGLGDQVSYSENYADASGELHDVFEKLGCQMIGYTSQEGYEHENSKAIRGDLFCGLLCDEINQDDLSEERVQNWVAQLKAEGILDGSIESSASPTPSAVIDAEVVVTPSTETIVEDTVISKLEAENAMLRKLLEESKTMDKVLANDVMKGESGYKPYYNPKSCSTMWVSSDGKKCYYTTESRIP